MCFISPPPTSNLAAPKPRPMASSVTTENLRDYIGYNITTHKIHIIISPTPLL